MKTLLLTLALLLVAPFARAQAEFMPVGGSNGFNVTGQVQGALGGGWASFSPGQVNPVLSLSSDVGVTTSGSNVTAWTDQSGQGNSATAGTACTLVASSIKSHPVVRCNGSTQFMTVTSVAALNFGTGSFDVFLVGTPQKASTFQVPIGKGSNALGNNLRFFENGTNHPAIYWGTDAQNYSAPGTNPTLTAGTSTMVEWGFSANGSSSTQRLAGGGSLGTNTQTVTGTGSNSSALRIGSDVGGVYFAQWDYAAIVMVGAYLAVDQRARMLTWASNLYGLSVQ